MSAEVTIIGNCVCGQALEIENDFTDDDVVLKIKPCKQCIEKALQGLVYNYLFDYVHSPKYVTLAVLKVYEEVKNKNEWIIPKTCTDSNADS